MGGNNIYLITSYELEVSLIINNYTSHNIKRLFVFYFTDVSNSGFKLMLKVKYNFKELTIIILKLQM